jgi:hypothetical protein
MGGGRGRDVQYLRTLCAWVWGIGGGMGVGGGKEGGREGGG